MNTIENREIRGITFKNIIVTVCSTVTIVVSVMGTYFGLRGDINDVRANQETTNRVNEVRLKTLEANVEVLQRQVEELKAQHR